MDALWTGQNDLTDRIDAEYYRPEFVAASKRLAAHVPAVPFKELWKEANRIYIGIAGFETVSDPHEYTPYLRPVDITDEGVIDYDKLPWCKRSWLDDHAAKGCAVPGDIIVEVKGNTKKVAVVSDRIPKNCIVSGSSYRVHLKPEHDPYYVSAFLKTEIGQLLKRRLTSNINISYIDPDSFRTFQVPKPSPKLQKAIGNCIRAAEWLHVEAVRRLRHAEASLSELLGLSGLQTSGNRYAWTELDLFDPARADAEYYQSHFITLQRKIESYEEAGIRVSCLGSLKVNGGYGVLPSSDDYGNGDMPFLRAQDVGHFILTSDQPLLVPSRYANPKAIAREGEVLLEVKGQLAGGCLCPRVADGWLVNGSVYRMKLKGEIDSGYALAVLLSPLGVLQKRRAAANNIISYLSVDFLDALKIPRLSDFEEREIGDCIRAYADGIAKSKHLMALAIADVECLIDGKLDEDQCLAEGRKLAEEFELEVPQ